MSKNHLIQIGEIYREHGIRGQVKVYLYSGSLDNFSPDKTITLKLDGQKSLLTKIENVKPFKKWFLTKFDKLQNIEEAKQWRKASIWIREEDLKTLDEGEFYLYELIGMEVWQDQNSCLGIITELQGHDMNPILKVENSQKQEILIPYVSSWIEEFDQKQKRIFMNLPEGLVEANQ